MGRCLFSSRHLEVSPGEFRFKGSDTRNGAWGGGRGTGDAVCFIPVRVFPAFVHILLIWAVGPLSSAVPGIPSEVLVLEGPGKDRSGQASHSSKFLGVSVLLGRVSLSPPQV